MIYLRNLTNLSRTLQNQAREINLRAFCSLGVKKLIVFSMKHNIQIVAVVKCRITKTTLPTHNLRYEIDYSEIPI